MIEVSQEIYLLWSIIWITITVEQPTPDPGGSIVVGKVQAKL